MYNSSILASLGIFFFIIIAGAILVFVLYLINLQNLLKEIKPENRQVEPGNVWLMFIPLFNLIYPFILYPKICDSTKAEFQSRGLNDVGDFSKSVGITMPILSLCGWIPILGGLAGIANLVLFIIFWAKTADYKNQLKSNPAGSNILSSSKDLLD